MAKAPSARYSKSDEDKADPKIENYHVHPTNPDVVLGTGEDKRHFLSDNAGKTWRKILSKNRINRFIFHPKRPKWAIVTSLTEDCRKKGATAADTCNHMAWITTDLGERFTLINAYRIGKLLLFNVG